MSRIKDAVVEIKILQKGAVSEVWWPLESTLEMPSVYIISRLPQMYAVSPQFLPIEVTIVRDQRSDDAI